MGKRDVRYETLADIIEIVEFDNNVKNEKY